MGSAPRLLAAGGGQSWLVGNSPPSVALFPGVQASPSLGPALHVFVIGLQIAHD